MNILHELDHIPSVYCDLQLHRNFPCWNTSSVRTGNGSPFLETKLCRDPIFVDEWMNALFNFSSQKASSCGHQSVLPSTSGQLHKVVYYSLQLPVVMGLGFYTQSWLPIFWKQKLI